RGGDCTGPVYAAPSGRVSVRSEDRDAAAVRGLRAGLRMVLLAAEEALLLRPQRSRDAQSGPGLEGEAAQPVVPELSTRAGTLVDPVPADRRARDALEWRAAPRCDLQHACIELA